ncbi:hypothetical protein D9M70_466320 [compost metagenome]
MIEEVEVLLQHWGEQCRRGRVHGGGDSPLASLIAWKGMPPRTGFGSVSLVGGSIDLAAAEVDAALAVIGRDGEAEDAKLKAAWKAAGNSGAAPFCLETQLVKLARVRYLTDPMPPVEQQMKRVKIDGRRTYDRRVQELHKRVQVILEQRIEGRAA